MSDEEVVRQFDEQATGLYTEVAQAARDALKQHRPANRTVDTRAALQREHARLAKQLDTVAHADFYASKAGNGARAAVDAVREAIHPPTERGSLAEHSD